MILRKPYALFIKCFRLFHFIITICIGYLLTRSYSIYHFIAEYMKTTMLPIGSGVSQQLIAPYMYIIPFVIIIVSIIILIVLFKKKKPTLLYFINILVYIIVLVIYGYINNSLIYLEQNIMLLKELRLLRDLCFISFILQLVMFIFFFVRSSGFDLKRFDFKRDLIDMDVIEADSEEFEINVDFEGNLFQRQLNKNIRNLKYFYKENKTFIYIFCFAIIGISGYFVYKNLNIHTITLNQGESFSTNDNSEIGISKSYLTRKNNKGEQITDQTLLILDIIAKANYDTSNINLSKFEIDIDEKTYYNKNDKYKDLLSDLGDAYINQKLDKNYKNYILIFEIPNSKLYDKISLKYLDNVSIGEKKMAKEYITVKLNPISLDNNNKTETAKLGTEYTINESLFGDSKFQIDSITYNKQYELKYSFCLSKTECYDSKEYIKANLNSRFDKGIFRIVGSLKKDENYNITTIKSLYNLINKYGTFIYKIGDKTYKIKPGFDQIEPKKISSEYVFYIEINEKISSADKIYLELNIRNKKYKFTVK